MYDVEVPAELRLPDADETETGPRQPEQADSGSLTSV
jgi:hypothetical protein